MFRYFSLFALTPLVLAGCSERDSAKSLYVPLIESAESFKLSSYRGKVVLLDFWATWCPPCRAEIPHERALASRFSGKPFVMIGISQDEKRDALAKFLQTNPVSWVNIFDGDGKITNQWNVSGIPTFVLIDHNGEARGRWVGGGQSDEIEKAVAVAVAAAEKQP